MGHNDKNGTIIFNHEMTDAETELKELLSHVYMALDEKGLNAIQQMVGYLVSDDPTYITSNKNARSMIQKVDRYEVLAILLKHYIGKR